MKAHLYLYAKTQGNPKPQQLVCFYEERQQKKPGDDGGTCSVAELCPTLCNLMDCSPPGSSVHEVSQARILEIVTISFSRVSSQPRNQTYISCIGRRSLDWEHSLPLSHQGSSEIMVSYFENRNTFQTHHHSIN